MPDKLGLTVVSRVAASDRAPFIKALAHIAAIDDEVTLDEKKMVMSFADAWDLSENEIGEARDVLRQAGNMSLDALVNEFSEPDTPFLLVQELVRLSHADGTYGKAERKEINVLAQRIGIEESVVSEIEEWVERGLAWSFGDEDDDPDLESVLDRDYGDDDHDLNDIPTADDDDIKRLLGDDDDS